MRSKISFFLGDLEAIVSLTACRSVFASASLVYPMEKDAKAVGLSYAQPKAVIRGKLVVDRQYGAFVQKGDANGAKGSEAEGLALVPYKMSSKPILTR
jgi:hypothetical protein